MTENPKGDTPMLSVEEIERLKELLEKATPGPWEIIPQHGAGPMIAHPFDTGKQMNPKGLRLICHVMARGNSLQMDDANAGLIAAMRTALPLLLAEVERGREVQGDNSAGAAAPPFASKGEQP